MAGLAGVLPPAGSPKDPPWGRTGRQARREAAATPRVDRQPPRREDPTNSAQCLRYKR